MYNEKFYINEYQWARNVIIYTFINRESNREVETFIPFLLLIYLKKWKLIEL